MAKGDFGFAAGTKLDSRLQRSLPAQSISNFMIEVQRQLRAGLITETMADDAIRKLRAQMIVHRLENGDASDTAAWIEMSPQQRQQQWDSTKGLSNSRETPEAIEARQQLALDRVALNTATDLTNAGVVSVEGYNALVKAKAPSAYVAARKRIGLGQEQGIDGELRPLSEAEELKLARALAALDRGEDIADERPPPEPAPAPPSYPKSRSQFSDFNMDAYVKRRDQEEAEHRRREAYEGDAEADADEQPREF
jgi:hypothetical protein